MFVSKKYAVATKAIVLAGIELTAEPSPDLISVLWPSRLWQLQHEKKKVTIFQYYQKVMNTLQQKEPRQKRK